jgi:hypothetical protein
MMTCSYVHGMPTTTKSRKSTTVRKRRQAGEPLRKLYSASSVSNESWRTWLLTHLTADEEENGAQYFNGRRVMTTDTRALHRWLHEEASPSFFRADAWCVQFGLSINKFLEYCKANKVSPWQRGEAPYFETETMSTADWAEVEAAWPLPKGVEELPVQHQLAHAA